MEQTQIVPFLSSNTPLPDRLHIPLFSFLDGLTSSIHALEGQEERLKRELEQVQEELAKKREEHRQFSIPLKAIRRVPPEIIAKIFVLALKDLMPFNHRGRIAFAQLRNVCSLWRQTAFSTPHLWTGVYVSREDTRTGTNAMDRARMICRWLARAGSSAQTLIMAQEPDVIGVEELTSCPSTLSSLSTLSISSLESLDNFYELVAILKKPTSLTHLTLELQNSYAQRGSPCALDERFPDLRFFAIKHKARAGVPPRVTHNGLRALHLYKVAFPSAIAFAQYLTCLPSLEELYTILCAFLWVHFNAHAPSKLVHPSLRHIAVAIDYYAKYSAFSTTLPRCPRLERISVMIGPSDGRRFYSTATATLPRFIDECQSKDLILDTSSFRENGGRDAEIIGQTSAHIQHLYIEDMWRSEVLEKLTAKGGAPPQVLVTSVPPDDWDGADVYWEAWLDQHLPFRKQLSSMQIYSPLPLKADSCELAEELMYLFRVSGFECTFLRRDEIDRMLGGVWDCVGPEYSCGI